MKDNNVAFIIQARLGSTRLPNKIIIPFYNEYSIFDILIEKLTSNFKNISIILATSKSKENDILERIAQNNKKISVFRGDEEDVLKRFIDAADYYNVNRIIRICADNPFLDVVELQRIISFTENNNYDYVSFNVEGTPSIKTHFGFWTEFVTLDALKKINTITTLPLYHEHVTNFIYENPEEFKIYFLEPNQAVFGREDIRMTLDTEKDFKILSEIYKVLNKKYNKAGISEIIRFLDKNPNYKNLMTEQIKMNIK